MMWFLREDGFVGPRLCEGPVVAFLAANAAAISAGAAIVGTAATLATATKKPKSQGLTADQIKAQQQQTALYQQQQAATARAQNDANTQTAALDARLAGQQAAVLARRKGTGGLSYTGPQLKSTLGG